jgi:hypothetical protein
MSSTYIYLIYSFCVLGFSYGLLHAIKILKLDLKPLKINRKQQSGEDAPLIINDNEIDNLNEDRFILTK